jgi:methylglutaconyl-CoA hydratase
VTDVLVDRNGPVATLTLNRPERRNALDPTLLAAVAELVRGFDADAGVRAVVLTGAGASFSAGADLEWMREASAFGSERNRDDARDMQRAFDAVDGCATPMIARVHGPAIGGGAGLVACADVAIAEDHARFAFPEVRLGLMPAVISPYILRAIGPGPARALITSGEAFGAERALQLGLVHRVVAPASLDEAVADAAEAFVRCGPDAVAAAKRLVRDASASLALPDLPERLAAIRAGPEAREGVDAFLARRAPVWPGFDAS